jgi:hypothetical protein
VEIGVAGMVLVLRQVEIVLYCLDALELLPRDAVMAHALRSILLVLPVDVQVKSTTTNPFFVQLFSYFFVVVCDQLR